MAEDPQPEVFAVGWREKFFEREREIDPDTTEWDRRVLACEAANESWTVLNP
jgi:hypothetical protein